MGRAAGTGSPINFSCPGYRKLYYRDRSHHDRVFHTVERTGKARSQRPSGALGQRNMLTAFEYRCRGCGHVGWTTHGDIVSSPLAENQIWIPASVRPYGHVEVRDADGATERLSLGRNRTHQRIDERWVEWRQVPKPT